MNVICVEKEPSLSLTLSRGIRDLQVFSSKSISAISALPESSVLLIDTNADLSDLSFLEENLSWKKIFVLYETFDELQPFFDSRYPEHFTFIKRREFSSKKWSEWMESLTLSRVIPQAKEPSFPDFRPEILKGLFAARLKGAGDPGALLPWICGALETRWGALFTSRGGEYALADCFGISRDFLSNFRFRADSSLVNCLERGRSFLASPGLASHSGEITPDYQELLRSMKMSCVLLLESENEPSFLLFLSEKETGCPFSWSELKMVKVLVEVLLQRDSVESFPEKKTESPSRILAPKTQDSVPLRNFALRTSNEFKNALVSIKTFVQLLPEKYKDANFRGDFFKVITREVSRLENLMDTIGFFAQDCIPENGPCLLPEILETSYEAVRSFHPQFKIQFDPGETPEFFGDGKLLFKAFFALLLNAAEAMNGAGSAQVSLSWEKKGRLGDCFECEISDSGKPMGPESAGRIFDPFYSTKPGNLGLGLTLAKAVFEAHRGTLSVTNNEKGGVTARVSLSSGKGVSKPELPNIRFDTSN